MLNWYRQLTPNWYREFEIPKCLLIFLIDYRFFMLYI
jgi:hypothetical protein